MAGHDPVETSAGGIEANTGQGRVAAAAAGGQRAHVQVLDRRRKRGIVGHEHVLEVRLQRGHEDPGIEPLPRDVPHDEGGRALGELDHVVPVPSHAQDLAAPGGDLESGQDDVPSAHEGALRRGRGPDATIGPDAAAQAVERPCKGRGGDRLQQVALGVQVEGIDGVPFVGGAEHDMRPGRQRLRDVEPVPLGHRHVEEDDVRIGGGNGCQGLRAIARLAHDLHVLVRRQQRTEAVAGRTLVVYQQRADHRAPRATAGAAAGIETEATVTARASSRRRSTEAVPP